MPNGEWLNKSVIIHDRRPISGCALGRDAPAPSLPFIMKRGLLIVAMALLAALVPTITHAAEITPRTLRMQSSGDPDLDARMAFLTRIRNADPDYRFVLIACLKGDELNLLLSRFVTSDEIPVLVRGLLELLRKDLPGRDLGVVAFRPVVPLTEAGVARFNVATGQSTYWNAPEPAPR
jgi:hypothetical protein